MAMVVKNNMAAKKTLNTLNKNSSALTKSLKKVSSGMKINSAADDASGYAISERMRVQLRSLDQANENAQNGSSMMKVAEGAVSSTVEILKTLKEKAVNAANDSNTDSDRQTIQKELDQSIDQINDNANVTFNGKYLVDGSKNSKGNATYTVLTNQSLSTSTDASTLLTDLCARNGDSLNITSTDSITVSYVQAGKTYTTTFDVTENSTLQDIFNAAEDVNKNDTIFANSSNANVLKAGNDALTDEAIAATQTQTAEVAATKATMDAAYSATATEADANKITIATLESLVTAYNTTGNNYISGTPPVKILYADANNFSDVVTYASALENEINTHGMEVSVNGASTAVGEALRKLTSLTTYTTASNTYNAFSSDQKDLTQAKLLTGSQVGYDANGDAVNTASGENGISVTANTAGIAGQISGLTISVSDSKGNVKKSANAALDAFNETIRAQNASEDNAITIHVGAKANQSIKVGLTDMRSEALGLQGSDGSTLNISTQSKANAAINVLDNAIQKALDQQTTIGSVESRLEYTANNLTTASENVTSAESTIRDADMAKEMTEYAKNNVLMQAAQSMLAQANQSSSDVLSLLQ